VKERIKLDIIPALTEKIMSVLSLAISGLVAGLLEMGILIFLTILLQGHEGLDIAILIALPVTLFMMPFFLIGGVLGGLIVFILRRGLPSERALKVGGALGGLAVPWLMLLYGLVVPWLMLLYGWFTEPVITSPSAPLSLPTAATTRANPTPTNTLVIQPTYYYTPKSLPNDEAP
jgi:hypothetical protein